MNITSRITSAVFSACITKKEDLPKDDLPVIALVGRSNVGKSSLINSLTGRKELARTSSTPGKTLTMNFYCINDAFYLVDLPGYGYAKASKSTRNKIQLMMNDFFVNCSNLKGVVQIIDIRHKPMSLDIQMHNWLKEQHFNGFVVLTKIDKLSNQQCNKMKSMILKEINGSYSLLYSSKTCSGRDEFLDAIEKVIGGFEFKIIENKTRLDSDSDEDEDKDDEDNFNELKEIEVKNNTSEKNNSEKNNQLHENNHKNLNTHSKLNKEINKNNRKEYNEKNKNFSNKVKKMNRKGFSNKSKRD